MDLDTYLHEGRKLDADREADDAYWERVLAREEALDDLYREPSEDEAPEDA